MWTVKLHWTLFHSIFGQWVRHKWTRPIQRRRNSYGRFLFIFSDHKFRPSAVGLRIISNLFRLPLFVLLFYAHVVCVKLQPACCAVGNNNSNRHARANAYSNISPSHLLPESRIRINDRTLYTSTFYGISTFSPTYSRLCVRAARLERQRCA